MIPDIFRSTPAQVNSDRLKILVPSADQRISRDPVNQPGSPVPGDR
jgi:hypothetical protein